MNLNRNFNVRILATCITLLTGTLYCEDNKLPEPSLKIDFENWAPEKIKGLKITGKIELTKGYNGKGWNCQNGSSLKISGDNAKFLNYKKGTVALWFKPNWNGLDGKAHFFMYASSNSSDGKSHIEPTIKFSKGYLNDKYQDLLFIYSTPGSPNAQAAGNVIEPFKWTHLAATWDKDKNEMRLYLNGKAIGSRIMGKYPEGEKSFQNTDIFFGAGQNGECSADGVIDNIMMFDKSLSGDEISRLFINEKIMPPAYPEKMESEILDYLKEQDVAKFENNPWLKIKSSSGNMEMLFSKRAHHGYWGINELPAYIEADLGKPFSIEAFYVEDTTWEDFGAGKYEILVYDDSKNKFVQTNPPAKYEQTNKRQKGHRKIFTFNPVTTSKIRFEAYEGRGTKPKEFYLKRISVLPKLSEALKFHKDFLSLNYETPAKSRWNGKWIWYSDTHYKRPELKKDFKIDGEIGSAKLQGNAKNIVDVKINGTQVYKGNGEPSFITPDISKYLKIGDNNISAIVENGEWPGGVILELLICLKDGREILILSDDTWMARKKNEEWQSAAFLTQDIYGRWNSQPMEDFKRFNIGTLLDVKIPKEIKAGSDCVAKLSFDILKKIKTPEEITIDLIDGTGKSVMKINADTSKMSDSWEAGTQNISLSFTPSRYLTPGEYIVKLNMKETSFSGKYKDGCIGKIKINPPQSPIENIDVKVKKNNSGQPAVFINGKDVYPMFYLYNNMNELKMMRDSGIHLYTVPTSYVDSFWKDYNTYDLSAYEKHLREILDADPNAYIIVDLNTNINVKWWTKLHPDDQCRLSDGKLFKDWRGLVADSFGSETGLKDSAKLVFDIISHLENSPFKERIIGYRFYKAAGGEWYGWATGEPPFPDHSPAMRDTFRKYLKGKYGTLENLRKSWNNSSADFETVEIPTDKQMAESSFGIFRDMQKEQQTVDYFESVAYINEHYIEAVLKNARAASNGKKIVGIFYGYTFELWETRQFMSGHLELNKLLKSGTADFLCAPISYYMRYVGEPGVFFLPVDSISQKGVLYFDDSDFRTHLSTIKYPHEHLPQDSLSVLWRHFGTMLQKNYAFQWHGFGPWFICPSIRNAFTEMNKLGNEAGAEERQTKESLQLPEKDRIAIIVSERAPFVMGLEMKKRFNYYLLAIQRESFAKIGASYDMLLMEELLERKELNYKAYLFLNTFSLSDKERKIIKEKIAVNGNVVAWVYAPGLYNGQSFSEEYMKDITGISLKLDKNEGPLRAMVTNTGNPLTSSCEKGDTFGNGGEKISPRIYSDDPSAEILGTCSPENRPGIVVKDMGTWKSVFIAVPRIPASVLRGICRLANVHIYSDNDLTIYPNRRYITIYPDKHMTADIKFPAKVRLFDMINQKWLDGEFSSTHKLNLLADKPYIYKVFYQGQ